jgi:hypothetical protein
MLVLKQYTNLIIFLHIFYFFCLNLQYLMRFLMAITNTYIHADWDKIFYRDYYYITRVLEGNVPDDPNVKPTNNVRWYKNNIKSFWLGPNVCWDVDASPSILPNPSHDRELRHFTHVRVEDAAEAYYKSGPINRMKAILDDTNYNIMQGAADAYQSLRYFRCSIAYPMIRSGTATLKTRAADLKQTKQVLINAINTA